MANNYYLSGYTPPSTVTNSDQVRQLQQQLGVKADGIWGPQTQAAYNSSNGGGTQSYVPAEYKSILSEVQSLLGSPTVNYQGMGQAELEAGMRPSYDIAISNRRKQTGTERANIDSDAASRGMGRSTWVTDVKHRAGNREAADVSSLEAGYAQQLMQALQAERANQLAADQFNANAKAQALQSALGLTSNLYGNYLSQQQAAGSGRRGSSGPGEPDEYEPTEQEKRAKFLYSMFTNPNTRAIVTTNMKTNLYDELYGKGTTQALKDAIQYGG